MSWTNPVFDRTEQDVQNRTAKGYLNIADYNRIEGNLQYLAEQYKTTVPGKTWTMDDFPTPAQFGRLLANLSAVLRAYRTMPTWPAVPTMPVNSYEKVNDIERLIHLSRTAWDADGQNALYCGEGAAGETIGVI